MKTYKKDTTTEKSNKVKVKVKVKRVKKVKKDPVDTVMSHIRFAVEVVDGALPPMIKKYPRLKKLGGLVSTVKTVLQARGDGDRNVENDEDENANSGS